VLELGNNSLLEGYCDHERSTTSVFLQAAAVDRSPWPLRGKQSVETHWLLPTWVSSLQMFWFCVLKRRGLCNIWVLGGDWNSSAHFSLKIPRLQAAPRNKPTSTYTHFHFIRAPPSSTHRAEAHGPWGENRAWKLIGCYQPGWVAFKCFDFVCWCMQLVAEYWEFISAHKAHTSCQFS